MIVVEFFGSFWLWSYITETCCVRYLHF